MNFLKSTFGRFWIALAAILVLLVWSIGQYASVIKPACLDIFSRLRARDAGARTNRDVHLLAIKKMMPLKEIKVLIEEQDGCLSRNQINADGIKHEIAHILQAPLNDTASDAATVKLTVYERSAAPFSFRSLILTNLTVTAAKSAGKEDDAGPIVYRDERSDIYSGSKGLPLQAAIDKAITTMQVTFALANTNQNPLRDKMYPAPQKTIEGQQAP